MTIYFNKVKQWCNSEWLSFMERVRFAVCCAQSLSRVQNVICNLMECSPPGSSVHVDSPGKNTGVGCHSLLQRIFPASNQEANPRLLTSPALAGEFFTTSTTWEALVQPLLHSNLEGSPVWLPCQTHHPSYWLRRNGTSLSPEEFKLKRIHVVKVL